MSVPKMKTVLAAMSGLAFVLVAAAPARAVTASLSLAPGQAATIKQGQVVQILVNLTNNTKASDLVQVKLTYTVVCPFRPAPMVFGFTINVPMKAGQAISQKVPVPFPAMFLLKPLGVTISADAKGLTSKTEAAAKVSFTVTP
jgi:hypothetical protein